MCMSLLDFLHYTPVECKPGSCMPNKTVADLHKMSRVEALCVCKSIFVCTTKTEKYIVLSVGTF